MFRPVYLDINGYKGTGSPQEIFLYNLKIDKNQVRIFKGLLFSNKIEKCNVNPNNIATKININEKTPE